MWEGHQPNPTRPNPNLAQPLNQKQKTKQNKTKTKPHCFALQAEGRLRLTLMDHNAVSGTLTGLGDAVVEIVDHHIDLGEHTRVRGASRYGGLLLISYRKFQKIDISISIYIYIEILNLRYIYRNIELAIYRIDTLDIYRMASFDIPVTIYRTFNAVYISYQIFRFLLPISK